MTLRILIRISQTACPPNELCARDCKANYGLTVPEKIYKEDQANSAQEYVSCRHVSPIFGISYSVGLGRKIDEYFFQRSGVV